MKLESDSRKREDPGVKFWFWFVVVCALTILGINAYEAKEKGMFDSLDKEGVHSGTLPEDINTLPIPPPEAMTDPVSFVITNFSKFNDYIYFKHSDVMLI